MVAGGGGAKRDGAADGDAARIGPNVVTDPSFSGALDELPGIVGSLSPTIELMVPMRGSGTAGTAGLSQWSWPGKACGNQQKASIGPARQGDGIRRGAA